MTKEQRHKAKQQRKQEEHLRSIKKTMSRNFVMNASDEYLEHMDMIIMLTLVEDFGFPPEALEAFYYGVHERFRDYDETYTQDDDLYFNALGDWNGKRPRTDMIAAKKHLLETGFDYDAVYKKLRNHEECSSKSDRYRNNILNLMQYAEYAKDELFRVAFNAQSKRKFTRDREGIHLKWLDKRCFSDWLKARCDRSSMNLRDLSEDIGLSAPMLDYYLIERCRPSEKTLKMITEYFGEEYTEETQKGMMLNGDQETAG